MIYNMKRLSSLFLFLALIFIFSSCSTATQGISISYIEVESSTLKTSYDLDNFDLSSISIRVAFSDGKFQIVPITESMLSGDHKILLSIVGQHQITVTYQGKTTTINLNLAYNTLKTQLMTIYTIASTSGSFTGTYEEWLETVRGPQGNPGKEVTLQVSGGYIQWKYIGDSSWINLIELTSLVGPAGLNGTDGINGKEVTFRVSEGYIQWQYQGDQVWNNLVALLTLTGTSGQDGTSGTDGKEVTFQVSGGYIQWKYVGDSSWINLIELTSLVGPAGLNGTDGINGKEVSFRVSEGYIQWQYQGDQVWNNLVALSTLTGSSGQDGTNGTDGREVTFQISGGYIQWKYVGDSSWINLIELTSLIGPAGSDGLSAYEIYLIYYPTYTKTEAEWLDDLINGRLGNKTQVPVAFDFNDNVTSNEVIMVEYLSKIPKPSNPTRTGYNFLGWFIGDEKWSFSGHIATESIILKASWQAILYSISYELDGGLTNNPRSYSVESNIVDLEAPTKQGHVFLGWFDNQNYDGLAITTVNPSLASDLVLYAKWISYEDYAILSIANLNLPNEGDIVLENIILPTETNNGLELRWTSSNIDLLTNEGVVFRPDDSEANIDLMYEVLLNDIILYSKSVKLTIPVQDEYRQILDIQLIQLPNSFTFSQTINLPSQGVNGSNITWESSSVLINVETGSVSMPGVKTHEYVQLIATVSYKNYASIQKTFTIYVGYASDLFISYYFEGSNGNRKLIAVYNNTGEDIDLSQYKIGTINNPNAAPVAANLASPALSGTLAHGKVLVIYHSDLLNPSASGYMIDYANAINGLADGNIKLAFNYTFNGERADIVAVAKNIETVWTFIDFMGEWNAPVVSGSASWETDYMKDKTLVRKPDIAGPSTIVDWNQWHVYGQNGVDVFDARLTTWK